MTGRFARLGKPHGSTGVPCGIPAAHECLRAKCNIEAMMLNNLRHVVVRKSLPRQFFAGKAAFAGLSILKLIVKGASHEQGYRSV